MDNEQPKAHMLNTHPQAAVPSTFQVRSNGTSLMVTYSWNDFLDYALILIMLILANPLLFACLLSLLGSTIAMIVVAMPVPVEAVLFYRMVVGMLDKVTVTAGGGRLEIRYGPLPWPSLTIASDRIRKLYVERDRIYASGRGKGIIPYKVRQLNRPAAGIWYTYQLRAMVSDGPDIKLLGGLSSMDEGLYLEQTLERHLGIADHPVPGSITG